MASDEDNDESWTATRQIVNDKQRRNELMMMMMMLEDELSINDDDDDKLTMMNLGFAGRRLKKIREEKKRQLQ